jgi:hypothetical protein
MDDDKRARVIRFRRLVFTLAGSFVFFLTVGTSLIFAGYPNLGITLVAASPIALIGASYLLVRA